MRLLTLDFETFYSKDFSLSKMTTEAYIRDPLFQVIGFSYKVDDGEAVWVTGSDDYIEQQLRSLDIENSHLCCHNTAFDGAILGWRYNLHPKFMFDTLSLAKPVTGFTVGGSLAALAKLFCLGEKGTEVVNALGKRREDFTADDLAAYGEYCKNDVILTYNLLHVLRQYSTPQEMYIIDMMLRMYTDPVLELNPTTLERHLTEVQERKQKLMSRIDAAFGLDDLMSNPKFAIILQKLGVEPPMKTNSKGEQTYAFAKTDVAFKELLEYPDERVQAVMAARFGLKSTLEETRTQSFIQISQRGVLPIMLNYYGGHTGRASGGDKVNLQNLPRGGALRYSIRVPDGHFMVACDSAQIEARILGWFAGEVELTAAFAAGKDIYSIFASTIYGREISKSDKVERHVGKTAILGLGFGVGHVKFKSALKTSAIPVDITIEESVRIVDLYRFTYRRIKDLWKSADNAIAAMARGNTYSLGVGIQLECSREGIQLPNAMMLRYPNLRYLVANDTTVKKDGYYYDTRYGLVPLYGAKLIENIIQALARIVVFNQMAKIDQNLRKYDRKNGKRFKTALTVHDEVVAVVPESAHKQVEAMMTRIMGQPPKWAPDLPIACEAAAGLSYGECK